MVFRVLALIVRRSLHLLNFLSMVNLLLVVQTSFTTTPMNLSCFSAEDHVLSLEEQRKLAEAVAEEVAMETNAAYELRAED